MLIQPVQVLHRTGQWCSGVRSGTDVVAYDVRLLEQWRVPGRPDHDRCYLLLDEGVQLTRPVTFMGPLAGGWYIDLVRVEALSNHELVVHDLFVDLVVPPTAYRYEVLDLDELADALTSGAIDASTAAAALRDAQRFINRHLRDLDADDVSGWPDFPPAPIAELATLPPFADP